MSCDAQNEIITRAALEWIAEHTNIPVNLDDPEVFAQLPARAQLFVQKYSQLFKRGPGVISQSIEGMSMTFDANGDISQSVWALAYSLLMSDLKSQVRVYPSKKRW